MRVKFVQKNYEMSEKLQEIITKKLSKFNRYFDDDAYVTITMKKQGESVNKMEISIRYNDNFMRAEVSSDNMYDNIDVVLPKIEGQIRKYRTKLEKKLKDNAFKEDLIYASNETEPVPDVLVRKKQFYLQPMSADDAIFNLDMVDHDFYVFINEATLDVNVVYRRQDGDIGLLEATSIK